LQSEAREAEPEPERRPRRRSRRESFDDDDLPRFEVSDAPGFSDRDPSDPARSDEFSAAGAPPEDVAEVYVNVGRRDGVKPSDFHDALETRAGIAPQDTDYVRVRHRHSFVGTRRELVDRVVEALNGATLAGKIAVAEIARPRA
jgi:ATP-dependent RNA helicase DeaD